MILSITPNPVLDTTYFIDEFRPVYRTEVSEVTHLAGGKGNNTARALAALGVPARAFTALGGYTGRRVADLLAQEGIAATVAWVCGETRHEITLVDRQGEQRAFFTPHAPFTAADVEQVRLRYAGALAEATAVVLCGSSPGAEAAVLFPEILRLAADRGLPTLLDSSGPGLQQGIAAPPTIVKCNCAEAGNLLGRELSAPDDEWWALDRLLDRGVGWAILTLGERGALLGTGARRWSARPPAVDVVNVIGCGDAMTAGLMAGLQQGRPPADCLRLGMAAAAANTLTWEACQIERAVVARLEPLVEITMLA